jgi:hypothetical protein
MDAKPVTLYETLCREAAEDWRSRLCRLAKTAKTDDELYGVLRQAAGGPVVLIYPFSDPSDPGHDFYERFRLPGDRDMTFREAALIALKGRGIEP